MGGRAGPGLCPWYFLLLCSTLDIDWASVCAVLCCPVLFHVLCLSSLVITQSLNVIIFNLLSKDFLCEVMILVLMMYLCSE